MPARNDVILLASRDHRLSLYSGKVIANNLMPNDRLPNRMKAKLHTKARKD